MEQTTLQQYIEGKVRIGAGRDAIKEQVLAVGWTEDEFDRAYAQALVVSGVPAPSEGARASFAKRATTLDVVLNFFSFILLGITTTALGTLYFQIINKYFPDALDQVRNGYYYARNQGMDTDAVYYAIAALVVAYPIYYLVVRTWFRRFREDEGKIESKLTKWLTYLVLLGASVTIVGDLIAIIFTFLQGEVTARFFLKALTVLTIAGLIFGFYFLERRAVQYRAFVSPRVFHRFGYVLTGIVLVGIIIAFVAAGSPATERNRTFDTQRSNDLSNLANCVSQYAQQYERLPEVLPDLEQSSMYGECDTRDPETSAVYEYRMLKPLARTGTQTLVGEIELCATFALSSSEEETPRYASRVQKWYEHEVGRSCDRESVTVRVAPQATPGTPSVVR